MFIINVEDMFVHMYIKIFIMVFRKCVLYIQLFIIILKRFIYNCKCILLWRVCVCVLRKCLIVYVNYFIA